MPAVITRCCLLALCAVSSIVAQDVTKTVCDFEQSVWKPGGFSSADGSISAINEVPEALAGVSKQAMRVSINYRGGSFQFYNVDPQAKVTIPGRCSKLSAWVRAPQKVGFTITFEDANGNRHAPDNKNKKYEWGVGIDSTMWTQVHFTVPSDWAQPISIVTMASHNWGDRNRAEPWSVSFDVDQISATTDISGADDLLSMSVSSAATCKVFAGERPTLGVQLQSWLADDQTGTLRYAVHDYTGAEVDSGEQPVSVSDVTYQMLTPAVKNYGVYAMDLAIDFGAAGSFSQQLDFAWLPPVTELSEEEHANSPYGLCVHGGRDVLVTPFADAGIRWYRDYAFNMGWMNKSKGNNRGFTGWPNHRAIYEAYHSRGLGMLPITVDAIPRADKDTEPGSLPPPDSQWDASLIDIMLGFPTWTHVELDNEYELHREPAAYEKAVGWAHYKAYHKRFAEVVKFITRGRVKTVENGRAGIWPDRLRDCVASGAFDQIDVANIHHYCGAEAPEVNIGNHNTNFGDPFSDGKPPTLFGDSMREAVDAARSDGKQREVWLTEFGWDDLAGPVVSTHEKAVYLQRGYMTIIASGVGKGFWFFDLSGKPEEVKTFFGGCGLIDWKKEPELALGAMAGLTNALPAPTYLGDIYLDDDVYGMVFRNRGQLVAGLWTIHPPAGTIIQRFQAERLQDWLGNPIEGASATLGIEPVYAIGLDAGDPLMRQVPYQVVSRRFVQAAAGDQTVVQVRITNDGPTVLAGTVALELGDGFSSDKPTAAFSVAAGAQETVSVPLSLAVDLGLGRHQVAVHVEEQGSVIKRVPITVFAVEPAAIDVGGLVGDPGKTTVQVRIKNQSMSTIDATITGDLPASWSAESLTVDDLAPGEMRSLSMPVTWQPDVSDKPSLVRCLVDGFPAVERPLPPSQRPLPKAPAISIDGDLGEWPASARIPDWMLSTTGLSAGVSYNMAWAADGLYIGIAVDDSRMRHCNPKTFWEGDCFEFFLGTGGQSEKRSFLPEDHTFWFTPNFEAGTVYVGRWKRAQEIEATQYDIPGVRSVVKKTGETSYVMEVFLPASAMVGYQPKSGARMGVSLLYTVLGTSGKRVITWPRRKDSGIMYQPGYWGAWHLE